MRRYSIVCAGVLLLPKAWGGAGVQTSQQSVSPSGPGGGQVEIISSAPVQNSAPPAAVPHPAGVPGAGYAPRSANPSVVEAPRRELPLNSRPVAPVMSGTPGTLHTPSHVVQPPVTIVPSPIPQSGPRRNTAPVTSGSLSSDGTNHKSAEPDQRRRGYTRAGEWRHDPGHPHHRRHFICENNVIYLVDDGVYDDSANFYASPDNSLATSEDGYYDTFDPSVITAVETRLGDEGYYNGVIDTIFKPSLRDAIAKYQKDHGLTQTGRIDEPLLKELGLL